MNRIARLQKLLGAEAESGDEDTYLAEAGMSDYAASLKSEDSRAKGR